MKKNTLNKITILFVVLAAFGCKPKKIIVAPPEKPTNAPAVADRKSDNLGLLKSKDVNFNTLSLKGKASLNIGGDENNVAIQIRMQKDAKIWVSVTAIAGIEVARAVITPDSLFLRNNLERTYLRKPFNFVHRFTNKQVNFKWLQSVLTGNTIPDFMTLSSDLNEDNGTWVLSGLTRELAYRMLFNTLLKVREASLNDARSAQALKVTYDNYTPLNQGLFPSTVKINSMSGTKTIKIDLSFSRIEANVAVDFPFSVPKSYELIQ